MKHLSRLSILFATLLLPAAFGEPSPTPRTPLVRYAYVPGEITKLCDAAIDEMRGEIEAIKHRSFLELWIPHRSLLAFERASAELSDAVAPLTFMASVSTDAKLREEGSKCEEKVGQFYPTVTADKPLYLALKHALPYTTAQRRLALETFRSFEKNGMGLDDSKLEKLKGLKQKLASFEAKYSLNLNNDKSTVTFTKAELAGANENFLARLKKDASGRYIVTTKSTDYIQVMENVKSAEARRRMMLAYFNRGGEENTKLLEEAVATRAEAAATLGAANWADVQIKGRMAKDSSTVMAFLNGLKAKLVARKDQDLAKLLAYKKKLDPKATAIAPEDVAYLANQLKKTAYAVDDEKVAEYFPAEKTMNGLFDIYATLFGVKFVEVADAEKNGLVWAPGVHLYEIRDAATDDLRAYFFKDTIPREGKYGHAAAFSLVSGRIAHGAYAKPVSAIVANFTPPANGKPSLLLHDEVETLFHEFGHVMHQTLTLSPYASLAGSNVAQDFVEAPSQMLENWVWNREILKKISSHYRTGEPLPDELITKMLAAKDFNQGYFYIRQLLFGLYDMKLHSATGPVDVTKTYAEMHRELFGFDILPGTHFPGTFGHLMGGYDAGYYGYLWSEVYAQDMFSRFEREGLLNPKTGADYRRAVLESGDLREAIALLRQFLGREPNSEAFYKKLGI
ncbi:MAG: Zn-dependent oligopeptidase [Bdellovibrionales bacterium]|nr:Zn-dependent oligopeptidase [Bdellovibrionales bacterium]